MQRHQQQITIGFGGPLTPAVKILLWINVLIYLFLLFAQGKNLPQGPNTHDLVLALLALQPKAVLEHGALWQPLTYMFIHFQFIHLLFNALGLWWFGSEVERVWGPKTFLQYYFFCGIGAALAALFFHPHSITVGASGAIFGLLLAFGMLYPNRMIYIFFVLPLKAKYAVALFGAIEIVMLMTHGSGDGIARFAHLGGLVAGLVWFFIFRRPGAWKDWFRDVQKKRMRRRLRLIKKKKEDEEPYGYSNKTIH